MISDLYAFPPEIIAESATLTSQLIMAHRRLAELKGSAPLLPNQDILLNTLALQEAKDSSAIENIITSHDELFKQELDIPGSTALLPKRLIATLKTSWALP